MYIKTTEMVSDWSISTFGKGVQKQAFSSTAAWSTNWAICSKTYILSLNTATARNLPYGYT